MIDTPKHVLTDQDKGTQLPPEKPSTPRKEHHRAEAGKSSHPGILRFSFDPDKRT